MSEQPAPYGTIEQEAAAFRAHRMEADLAGADFVCLKCHLPFYDLDCLRDHPPCGKWEPFKAKREEATA